MAPRCLPVYLIHWNAPQWCASAIETLRATTGVDLRITVIDNHSSGADELRESLGPDIRFMALDDNRGYAGAANVAVRDWLSQRPAPSFCVLGSHDLHVEPSTFADLLEATDFFPEMGIIGPLLHTDGGAQGSDATLGPGRAARLAAAGAPRVKWMWWLSGTCLLLRRECAEQVGFFDERFGSYVEDVDYCLRARDAGWKVGLLVDAHARGLGSVSDDAAVLRASNTALLHAKRDGRLSAAVFVGRLVWNWGRSEIASRVPWGGDEQRNLQARSASHLRRAVRRGASLLWRYGLRPGNAGETAAIGRGSRLPAPERRSYGNHDESS